jgi:hypothetical protein
VQFACDSPTSNRAEEKDMKFRSVLSVFALSLVPLFGAFAQGCVVDDAEQSENITQISDYEMNLAAANTIWPDQVPIAKAEDAYTALVKVGDKTIPAPTHLFGEIVNIIPYSNEDGVTDASGATFKYGDQEVAKVFKPGDIGIGLKSHRQQHRVVDLNASDASAMKEDFKLQDTHIELVVGVEKAEHGKAGAITLNNPQNYENGRFGDAGYAPIFLRPEYPAYAKSKAAEYQANSLIALLGFNAVTNFPGDYNGGDPLGARNPEKLREYVDQMVRAIGGDETAREWFAAEENQVYCAELAFLALSAGIIVPINAATMVPRVGQAAWDKFAEQVTIHNRGVDEFQSTGNISDQNLSNFVKFNENKLSRLIRVTLAADSLKPMAQLAPNKTEAAKLLAYRPMTMADIVRQFMRTHLPRKQLGESLAPVQGAVLAKMKPGLIESMGMDQLPASDPKRVAVEQLFDKIVAVVKKKHTSYDAFQTALEPLMQQANAAVGPRGDSGEGLFTPPSLFHVVAQGNHLGGLLGLQYEGHGVHVSAVQKKNLPEPEPEPTPTDDIPTNVSCAAAASGAQNACGGQAPGGCWCDAGCATYGDCCADKTNVCGQ